MNIRVTHQQIIGGGEVTIASWDTAEGVRLACSACPNSEFRQRRHVTDALASKGLLRTYSSGTSSASPLRDQYRAAREAIALDTSYRNKLIDLGACAEGRNIITSKILTRCSVAIDALKGGAQ